MFSKETIVYSTGAILTIATAFYSGYWLGTRKKRVSNNPN